MKLGAKDIMETNSNKKFSRRDFLGVAWALSLVGLVGQAGSAIFQFIKPRVVSGTFGSQVTAGQVEEFEPGTVSHVQAGRFFVSRLQDGGILAIWHRCTHLGCTVPWDDEEGIFHCPCHSSVFDPQGEVVSGPAPRPLDLFPVEIVEGEIVVDTSRAISRDKFDPSQATRV